MKGSRSVFKSPFMARNQSRAGQFVCYVITPRAQETNENELTAHYYYATWILL